VTRLRRFWVLVVVSISVNVTWHFLVNWMADFFQEERGLGALAGGMASAIPFLAADAGNLGGGWVSRAMALAGLEPTRARMRVVALSTLMIGSGVAVGAVRSDAVILVLLSVMALGTAAYMANYFAFCQEVSERHTGLVVGLLGGLGNLFAAGFLPIAGRIKDLSGGFGPSFVIVGLLPMVGLLALTAGWSHKDAPAESA
jgi:ACS family hexuronate transporter-like MFS transporter